MPRDIYTRISDAVTVDETGCHIWTRSTNSRGYGVIWFDGKLRLAHRLVFRLKTGRWPDSGKVIDHICNVKRCVNPDHLRELENWQNLRRAVAPASPTRERQREAWRAANARRRNYSPSYVVGGERDSLVQGG